MQPFRAGEHRQGEVRHEVCREIRHHPNGDTESSDWRNDAVRERRNRHSGDSVTTHILHPQADYFENRMIPRVSSSGPCHGMSRRGLSEFRGIEFCQGIRKPGIPPFRGRKNAHGTPSETLPPFRDATDTHGTPSETLPPFRDGIPPKFRLSSASNNRCQPPDEDRPLSLSDRGARPVADTDR